jgi:hypothetical protein
MASSIVNCFQKAEKADKETSSKNCKELDESVVTFLRTRMEWHRLISHVEAKLQDKAQEMEALETYTRTQPRLGKKQKRIDATIAADVERAVQTTAAAANSMSR